MNRRAEAGFSLPEMLIVVAVTGIVAAFGISGYDQYRESIATRRAAEAIAADIQIARTLAIQGREPISLVVDETNLSYLVRDTAGTEYHWRSFDANSEIPLTALDLRTAGDSVTFDSRGILWAVGAAQMGVTRLSRTRTISFNALGRAVIN